MTSSERWWQILDILAAADPAAMYGPANARLRYHRYFDCDCMGDPEDLCPVARVEDEAYERLMNQAER